MRAGQTIKILLAYRNVTQLQLAKRLGCTRQNIQSALKPQKHGMRLDIFCKMIEALDYKVVIMPSTATVNANCYELNENEHDNPIYDSYTEEVPINPETEVNPEEDIEE